MKTKNTTGSIIAVIIILLILGTILCLPFFLPISNNDPPVDDAPAVDEDIIVNCGIVVAGTMITDNNGVAKNLYIYPGKTMTFDIEGIDYKSYTVSIKSNSAAEETFDFYSSSGQLRSFYMAGDLTSGFEVVKSEKSFSVGVPQEGMVGVLAQVYKSDITIVGAIPDGDLFTAVIVFDNATTLLIDFHIVLLPEGVEIDKSEVIF